MGLVVTPGVADWLTLGLVRHFRRQSDGEPTEVVAGVGAGLTG